MANVLTNRIEYTKPFIEQVQGQLKARFRLDSEGRPLYEPHPEDRRLWVFTIEVYLETPRAADIQWVKYFMDDPSYVDPEGYSEDADNQFREEITSYGDVEIVVTVKMKGAEKGTAHKYVQRAWLSNMLENGYGEEMSPAVRTAFQRLSAN